MKATLTDLITRAYELAAKKGELPDVSLPPWKIELPKNPRHGDYATNIAMVTASLAKRAPRQVAEAILANLEDTEGVLDSCEIAGPGFINFRFKPARWHRIVGDILAAGPEYGRSGAGGGKKVQVEFVSANPTGPLHVGHGRGALLGDVLASLLEAAGFDTDREYYINDAGNQMATLGASVYARYLELCGREVDFGENLYQGDYVKDIAAGFIEREGERYLELDEDEAVELLGLSAGRIILDGIRIDLEEFGVTFDKWFSERSLYESGRVSKTLLALEESGAAYRKDGALWLNTSKFGDEKDRVLVRADGRETYFASDIAYHHDKYERGYKEIVDVWGADHHGYVPRMKAALEATGHDRDSLDILMVQLVSLLRGGEPVSMSTRAGEFVTLEEVVKEVGRDAARFLFLTRSSDTMLDFDLEVAKQRTSDNPVFYVQYANARIFSVLREAKAAGVDITGGNDISLATLTQDEEIDMIKLLYLFPEVVEGAALLREPHRLAYYLQDLAANFHQYYNKHRFLVEDEAVAKARLALVRAISTVIVNGLTLMGVSAPESM
ncbi:MAG: arginine--tRNA ligase [Deltaproteobacteria bacterium]|nr:MAG: arginine--tRNA ligase [Deltaproteobacteria bacterium]